MSLFHGIGMLLRGFREWGTSPRAMLLGLIPGAITAAVFTTGIVILVVNLDSIAASLSTFADDWAEGLRVTARVVVGAAVLGAALLIAVYTFTFVTLLVGAPFFEKISNAVDERLGSVALTESGSAMRAFLRGLGEGILILLLTVLVAICLFLLGLIPLIGAVIAAVIGAITGGWFLALELTTAAFERRGLRLRERQRALAKHPFLTIGFGVATFVMFLIPFGAVAMMPVAVAGATLLARRVLGEPIERTRN
jgi:CysZ protein